MYQYYTNYGETVLPEFFLEGRAYIFHNVTILLAFDVLMVFAD